MVVFNTFSSGSQIKNQNLAHSVTISEPSKAVHLVEDICLQEMFLQSIHFKLMRSYEMVNQFFKYHTHTETRLFIIRVDSVLLVH